jgi:hypothetical protein
MMRHRVGYGGPEEYRHGQYFPGGRRNNGGMTEIERLIHLIASMQILFGSRRGGLIIPLLIVGLLVGGWFLYRYQFSPERALEQAHQMWDSNDSKEQIKAIRTYKALLQKTDPIEPGRFWLMDDRDTLYRRIIQHEVIYTLNEPKAAEWVLKAWDEGIRDLRFPDEKVRAFWDKTTESSRQKNKNRTRNQNGELNPSSSLNRQPRLGPQSTLPTTIEFSGVSLASSRFAS